METRRDGPRCIMNTSLETTQCFPFFRQRATVPRFWVPYILFLAAMGYKFGKGVVDRQRGVKGDFFSAVKERGREVG